jgi:hypothetical protein
MGHAKKMMLPKGKQRRVLAAVLIVLALSLTLTTMVWQPTLASEPQGLLIITRQIFVDSLEPFVQWKESKGFDVYVVTAEWIEEHMAGTDVRVKIRNCIRQYYYSNNVKYAMLIGDSIDVSALANETQPTPSLSEAWNLPAGYYWCGAGGSQLGAQYTSLYYSDLSDKVDYNETEYYWTGDYNMYVGVVPVRTPTELETILSKTINSHATSRATFLISNDTSSPVHAALFTKILALTGSNISSAIYFFSTESSSQEIYEKLFNQTGFLFEEAHGNLQLFKMGNTYITNDNVSDFQFINPFLITFSCLTQMYHTCECLDEAFLKAQKGPAVVLGGGQPLGNAFSGELSVEESGFWSDLFGGKPVGAALYDNCNGAWQNPITLFGDPSLTIFGEVAPYIVINNGDAFTTSRSVTLSLTYPDGNSGAYQVRYSNDGVWDTETWETSNKSWTLTYGDGTKIVYYQIKDDTGSVSPTNLATIILVTPTPTPTPTSTASDSQSTTTSSTPEPTPKPTPAPTNAPSPTSSPSPFPSASPSPSPSASTLTIPPEYFYLTIGVVIAIIAAVALFLRKK